MPGRTPTMVANANLDAIEKAIGHSFADRGLLAQALSHRSSGPDNNERLEFLGDAALGLVIAEWLFDEYPADPESELTLRRAHLVRRKTLAAIAREIDIGSNVRLGAGERASGGHRRESILADTVEAILGAVLKDGGIEGVRRVVTSLFAGRLGDIDSATVKDPKTRLQEWLQARGHALPLYTVVTQTGDAHAPSFRVQCAIEALDVRVEGTAGSRRDAEKAAAREALVFIGADRS